MDLERLSARLLADGIPPSLLIDLLDPEGMQRALSAELAEVEAGRTLDETAAPAADDGRDARSA